MYFQLFCAPDLVLMCETSGYTATVRCDIANNRCFVRVHDPELELVKQFEVDNQGSILDAISVTITLGEEYGRPALSVYIDMQDRAPLRYLLHFHQSFIPSSIPYQAFAAPLTLQANHARHVSSILYRIPTELSDFIRLPLVQPYNRKMLLCTGALLQHLGIRDVVCDIIVHSVELYHLFDYAEYCELQTKTCY